MILGRGYVSVRTHSHFWLCVRTDIQPLLAMCPYGRTAKKPLLAMCPYKKKKNSKIRYKNTKKIKNCYFI